MSDLGRILGTSALALAQVLAVFGCRGRAAEQAPPPTSAVPTEVRTTGPNVILIVISGVRADHLSAYGYVRPTTPNLERIAAEGVLYETCISPGAWTVPVHASMFTGLYPKDHGLDSEETHLPREFDTLPELFWVAGYRTAGATNNPNVSGRAGLFQGFDDSDGLFRQHGLVEDEGAELANQWLLNWLDERQGDPQRFFLYANYVEPSFPHRPKAPYDELFLPEGTDPAMVAEIESWKRPREMGYMLRVPGMEISAAQLEVLGALYDAELVYVDERLGELRDALEQRGLLDETILVIVGDVGEHLGEHGLLDHKMSLYEPILHVPLIVRYPPRMPAGRRIRAAVQSLDLFATLLELGGIQAPPGIAARPLPLADGPGVGRDRTFASSEDPSRKLRTLLSTFPGADFRPFQRSLAMVRGPQYKLIQDSRGAVELYDLLVDPEESRDLARDLPEVREGLEHDLATFQAEKVKALAPKPGSS